MLRAALLTAVLATAGCTAETDDRPLNFSYIHAAILVPNCATAGCHSSLTRTAGIDMEDIATARMAVTAGAIEPLLKGIYQAGGSYFPRMPPDQPLPDADIDLIVAWYNLSLTDPGVP